MVLSMEKHRHLSDGENTIAPWLEEQGFERGKNEKSVFYNKERDLLLLLYVDDCLVDGQEEDINWIFAVQNF